ncbi:origin recognition complex subunit 5-like, partial [Ruditapes philippinarum]|uniref:origin recognition complex subunit 5-like n=1 Tax=Ruditapes philippinarum TaxID=129788 RepID=UPI00295A79DC
MEAIHCRQKQVAVLKDLFGKPHQMSVPSLFIYGHTSTGKTLVLNTLLKTMKLPHVIVNCVECYNERFLYEYILNYIAGNFDMMAATADLIKCDNMNDFIRHLKQIVTGLNSETLYIVFDKAEFLRDMEPNILPTFLKLQELADLNVCVIMVSDIVWEKYRFGTGFCEPFVINFPDYSKEELVEILCLDCPEDYPIGFYNMYVNLVLSIFHYACTNLKELKHLVLLNFKHYTQPIKKGEVSITDTKKLWKNIEPHLKKAMSTLYLREVSSCQWENYQYQLETSENASLQGMLNIDPEIN